MTMEFLDTAGDVLNDVLARWLCMSDVVRVDPACCSHATRQRYLDIICSAVCDYIHPSMDKTLPVLVQASTKRARMVESVRLFVGSLHVKVHRAY
jgi:hypothetical protein